MPLPARFSLINSEFNEFLFASIGAERNDMPLSVLSALSRLGMDPWQEAARLSELPRERAAATLGRLLGQLPAGEWDGADTPRITARLVALLPQRRLVTASGPSSPTRRRRLRLRAVLWVAILAIGTVVLYRAAVDGVWPFGLDGVIASVFGPDEKPPTRP